MRASILDTILEAILITVYVLDTWLITLFSSHNLSQELRGCMPEAASGRYNYCIDSWSLLFPCCIIAYMHFWNHHPSAPSMQTSLVSGTQPENFWWRWFGISGNYIDFGPFMHFRPFLTGIDLFGSLKLEPNPKYASAWSRSMLPYSTVYFLLVNWSGWFFILFICWSCRFAVTAVAGCHEACHP